MDKIDTSNNIRSQFFLAKRALPLTDFPTNGLYFIKDIQEKQDWHGNRFPVALVEWKPLEAIEWVDVNEVKYLRLDYLFGNDCIRPAIDIIDVKHRILHVQRSLVSFEVIEKVVTRSIVVAWDIMRSNLKDETDENAVAILPKEDRLKFICKELLSKKTDYNALFGDIDVEGYDDTLTDDEDIDLLNEYSDF